MTTPASDSTVAVFTIHKAAEAAVRKLSAAGFAFKSLSVVGKVYRSDEKSSDSTTRPTG